MVASEAFKARRTKPLASAANSVLEGISFMSYLLAP
jgi:hypothetical protein